MLPFARYAGLVFAILIGLTLGQALGPVSSLPAIATVDEHYLAIERNHTLFLGLTGSLAACISNLLLRIAHPKVLLSLIVVAALWFTWFAAAEPGFLTNLVRALTEFLVWILISAIPIVGIFWLIERTARKNGNVSKR